MQCLGPCNKVKHLFHQFIKIKKLNWQALACVILGLLIVTNDERLFKISRLTLLINTSATLKIHYRTFSNLHKENRKKKTLYFSPNEIKILHKMFGVHGPQPKLTQLLTSGLDQITPLKAYTVSRLEELKPYIRKQAKLKQINPMLLTAILFDEMHHGKPGESLPILAYTGLFHTLGPAQLGVEELIHQGWLPPNPSFEQIIMARKILLDPESNIELLAGEISRFKNTLGLPSDNMLQISTSAQQKKALATLAYLHNGKLDYTTRILNYMQDPELHIMLFENARLQ
uniref:Helicase DnaB n=1 Tax=Paulinella chromatophora TaxID=39717 RepID=B1X3T8_PAUCH|nr:hypothetical protein PCC_0156 [Paulinella chromatophora]ACB42607.1 hypothetical protein PCC_0156 [Paulinella chromatophora]